MAHMVKGRQYNNAHSMCVHAMPQSRRCMNSTDRLSISIVDKNDKSVFQSRRRTRQHSTDRYRYGT